MLELLILLTAVLCFLTPVAAYLKYKDVFHPMFFIPPLFAFIYVYMPLKLIETGELFTFLSEAQATYVQTVILITLIAFMVGCFWASGPSLPKTLLNSSQGVRTATLHSGAYALGLIGLAAWAFTIRNAGGITGAFGEAYGAGASDFGYVREAAYLLIAALLLLLSPEGFRERDKKWTIAVVIFSIPWLMQGLLGARRGPTFMMTVTLVMSWFLARRKRPSPIVLAAGGFALGILMLFLVTNRQQIYIGSNFDLKTDVSDIASSASSANEYIFGAGCIISTEQNFHFYWGRRYLAQFLVRPIPHQIWPTKYEDFGIPEMLQNAGVVSGDLESVLGWKEVPGAAAAMVGDIWVEFYWLAVPFACFLGWMYGYTWRRAIRDGKFWVTEYTILTLLSIYLVTQSMEAVIFRLVILSACVLLVWRKALGQPRTALDRATAMEHDVNVRY